MTSRRSAFLRSPASTCLWDDAAAQRPDEPPLSGERQADVVIVGGGLTGLWTALSITAAEPGVDVAVVEAATCGFGASGRNGGWCSALFPESEASLAGRVGPEAARAQLDAMRDTVDVVGAFARSHGIDCDFHKGGTLSVATDPAHVERLRHGVHGDAGEIWLDAARSSERIRTTPNLGAAFTPHCAAIHPRKLIDGLVELALERGVRIYENSPIRAISPGAAAGEMGRILAPTLLRCTEGYTPTLQGSRRDLLPIYSLMIATEPLTDSTWSEIGLADRETFTDGRHLLIYGQRTADGRLAFGGRGAPYHFGSGITARFDTDRAVHTELEQVLRSLFPQIGTARITHRWGGALGVPRDWTASVGFDRLSGLGWAGGYVGDGVSTTNLAGRTLADLVLGRSTELTRLPWVNHRSRRWEPEPLRFLGVNGGRVLAARADAREAATHRPARREAALMERLTGGG